MRTIPERSLNANWFFSEDGFDHRDARCVTLFGRAMAYRETVNLREGHGDFETIRCTLDGDLIKMLNKEIFRGRSWKCWARALQRICQALGGDRDMRFCYLSRTA